MGVPSNEPINDEAPHIPSLSPVGSQSGRGLALAKSMRERQRIIVEKIRYDVTVADPDGSKATVTKTIMRDVDFAIPPRSLTAIMGATGAGKTTMLNMLANRIKPTEGCIRVNGKDYNTIPMQRRLGYVMQDDLLMPTQTVREALTFAAKLQLPVETTDAQRAQRVEDILAELGLQSVADSMIGSTAVGGRGISGGERKRVAIGLVLIPDPDILLLDEPTTGLDSFTAESVIDTLHELAVAGRTVICTIHQPSSQVFKRFTQLLLLALGRVAYCGAADQSVKYFSSIGYECPTYTNPPDFFMKLLRTGSAADGISSLRDTADSGLAFSNEAADKWVACDPTPYLAPDNSPPDTPPGKGSKEVEALQMQHDIEQYSGYAVGFFAQVAALSTRTARNIWRNPMLSRARIVQAIVLGLLIGCVFYDLGDDTLGVRAKQGALFFMIVNQSMLPMMGVLHSFPVEMGLVMRESQASLYSVTAHFVTKTLVELPFLIFFPVLFVSIPYYMVGLRASAASFWTLAALIVMTSLVAQSFGLLISAMAPTLDIAILLGPLIFLPFMLLAGFFVQNIPVWLEWLQHCSFVKWAFEGVIINEFDDRSLDVHNGSDYIFTQGDQVIDQLGMNSASIWRTFLILAGYMVLLRILAWAVLMHKSKTAVQQ
eukprot:TRINITY_DN2254_c0_g1_i5.p1 TRINITY_DN2254_c0_g1~~TRINITY_DN2254_c0_g1_i5.p1  ORF type:complete len:656 (+),score=251.85 TRINITY_DN2254_c0_g1_i5:500-2467(+)